MTRDLLIHYWETTKHKWQILRLTVKVCKALVIRAAVHDLSKYQAIEAETFAEVAASLRDATYGSEAYYARLKELEPALQHHYDHNSHHPEHFENGLPEMGILDVVEMLVDWKAASLRHNNGDIGRSIDHNRSRFDLTEDQVEKFRNFYREVL